MEYLRTLAGQTNPAVLLMVVPTDRLETIWRELERRLREAKLRMHGRDSSPSAGLCRVAAIDVAATDLGFPLDATPILAITSWANVLLAIEAELVEEPQRRNDLVQLRALCEAADDEASTPFSSAELTNQRTPSFLFR